jgi:hypothetical protein
VLDGLTRRAAIVWLNKGNVVSGVDIDNTQMLMELGALDSIDYFADGQFKCIVATEDSDQRYIKVLLESSGFDLDDVHILSYSGCSQVEAVVILGAFLAKKAPNLRVIVHRDRDYLPDDDVQKFVERMTSKGLIPFVTSGNDIETYFMSAAHLAASNPGLTHEAADALLSQAVEATKDATLAALINIRTEQANRKRKARESVNVGEIGVSATREYEASPVAMTRGDILLGKVSSLIQAALGRNANITRVTPHIDIPELRAIKSSLWAESALPSLVNVEEAVPPTIVQSQIVTSDNLAPEHILPPQPMPPPETPPDSPTS